MRDILGDPVKLVMLVILIVMSIVSAIALAVLWGRACREAEKQEVEDGN